MNIKFEIEKLIRNALANALKEINIKTEIETIIIEIPKDKSFGDYTTNVAMMIAKICKKKPRDMADLIIKSVPENEIIEKCVVAGTGFVNIFLKQNCFEGILKRISSEREDYGISKRGKGKKVLVEFLSANPTGPLHIGHGRNCILGDTIARLYEANGYEVTREYYYNDGGVQMTKLGETLRARYLQLLGENVDIPENGYKGDYMIDIAKKLLKDVGDKRKNTNEIKVFTKYAADDIMEDIKDDLDKIGIHFDVYSNESDLFKQGKVQETLDELQKRGYLYEKDGALWFKSSEFGDSEDKVIKKSDGSYTYLTPDIAYHREKFRRGYDVLVNIWGEDHKGYIQRLTGAIEALGLNKDALKVIIYGIVNLYKDGAKTKLSTRSGEFMTFKEILIELGPDVIRFFFCMRNAISEMVFDWDLAKESSEKNPVHYVRYGHARVCSIFAKAREKNIEWKGIEESDLSLLKSPEERDLINTLAIFPEVVEDALDNFAPHILTDYLRDLVSYYHKFYHDHRVISDDINLMNARFALIDCTRIVLKNGLGILGISAPERM